MFYDTFPTRFEYPSAFAIIGTCGIKARLISGLPVPTERKKEKLLNSSARAEV